jgi:hypothetical protein
MRALSGRAPGDRSSRSPDTGACQGRVQVRGQGRGLCSVGGRQRTHHDPRPAREAIHPITHQVAQLPLHAVAIDRRADGLAHDETDGRLSAGSWTAGAEQDVGDHRGLDSLASTTHRPPEVVPAAHPLTAREQRIRRTAWRDPCGGDHRGSRGRRGCACADGSRASWHDDGCSAGRCACSRCCPQCVRSLTNAMSAPFDGHRSPTARHDGTWARGRCRSRTTRQRYAGASRRSN